ncbi:hypothetical protein ACMD2_04592 [Ananas comosus]|uniref:Neprosin PEP catalytic domain-containing protein n=1 Tax=Ananas comosus TaxID=4615 RepID=A0A199W3A0_ANACO|nr:hypothetical protein ACMD2_04592 [Ananas comosus]
MMCKKLLMFQLRPSEEPFTKAANADSNSSANLAWQVWRKSGSCPEGTIPILRIEKRHLLNTKSLETYGRKPRHGVTKHEIHLPNKTILIGVEDLNEVSVLVGAGYSYLGIQARINTWNPRVEASDEFSSAQIWLRNGPFRNFDSVEAGWIVYPDLYNDTATRFFIYWAAGANTGCFNLLCSGFVQIDPSIALGARIDPISQEWGDQYIIELTIWKDLKDDDKWWVAYGRTTFGYWPASIFRGLTKVGTVALFGGVVYSPRMKQQLPHTRTAMGSGRFAFDHWGQAAFIGQPRIMDYSKTFKYPDPGQTFSTHTDCYSGENYAEVQFTEPRFYFGGPGRNMYCK